MIFRSRSTEPLPTGPRGRRFVSGFVVTGLVVSVLSVIVGTTSRADAATPNQLTVQYATTMPITRAVTQDQFATEVAIISGGGGATPITTTSTTTGTGAAITPGTGVAAPFTTTPGTTYSFLDKSPNPNGELPAYDKTVTCVDANGIQTGLPTNASWLAGSIFTAVTPVAGSNITCTITQVTRVAPLTCSGTTSGLSLTDYDQYLLAGDSHIVYGKYYVSASFAPAPLFGFNQVPAGTLIDALGISPGSSARLGGGAYAVPRSPAAGAIPIYEVNGTTWATSTFVGPTPVTAGGQFFAGGVAKNGIYYIAEVVAGEVDIYGFNTATNTAIPGRIARLLGVTTLGDLAFDALGYLYFNNGTVLDRTTLVIPTTGVDSSLTFAKEQDTVNNTPSPQFFDGFDFDQVGGVGALTSRGAGAFTGYYPTTLFPTGGTGFANTFPGGGVQNYDDMGSCNYAADITLQKSITNRLAAGDQFGLTIVGAQPSQTFPFLNFATGATTGATLGLQTAAGEVAGPVGTTNFGAGHIGYFDATETALGTANLSNYAVVFSCTDLNGGTVLPSGVPSTSTSSQVTQRFLFNDPTGGGLAGENIVCTVTNGVRPTITITNTGQVAYPATSTFTDSAAAVFDDATYVSGSTGVTHTGNIITWTGALPVANNLTNPVIVTYVVHVTNPPTGDGVLTNLISAGPPGGNCPQDTINCSTQTCPGQVTCFSNNAFGQYTTVKTESVTNGATIAPGTVVTFTLSITNNSSTALPSVTVIDDLQDTLDDATFGTITGNAARSGNSVVWNGALPVSATPIVITYTVTVNNPDTGNGTLASQLSDVTVGGNCPAAATSCSTNNPVG